MIITPNRNGHLVIFWSGMALLLMLPFLVEFQLLFLLPFLVVFQLLFLLPFLVELQLLFLLPLLFEQHLTFLNKSVPVDLDSHFFS
jgi:hypothetical protein